MIFFHHCGGSFFILNYKSLNYRYFYCNVHNCSFVVFIKTKIVFLIKSGAYIFVVFPYTDTWIFSGIEWSVSKDSALLTSKIKVHLKYAWRFRLNHNGMHGHQTHHHQRNPFKIEALFLNAVHVAYLIISLLNLWVFQQWKLILAWLRSTCNLFSLWTNTDEYLNNKSFQSNP